MPLFLALNIYFPSEMAPKITGIVFPANDIPSMHSLVVSVFGD